MKLCQAFAPSAGSRNGWLPCGHKAPANSRYCCANRDALMGVLLDLLNRMRIAEASAETFPESQRHVRSRKGDALGKQLVTRVSKCR